MATATQACNQFVITPWNHTQTASHNNGQIKLFGSFSLSLEEFLYQFFTYPAEVLKERTP